MLIVQYDRLMVVLKMQKQNIFHIELPQPTDQLAIQVPYLGEKKRNCCD